MTTNTPAEESAASKSARGTALLLVAAFSFASMAVFAKLAASAGFERIPLLALRFGFGTSILWGLVWWRGVKVKLTVLELSILVGLGAIAYVAMAYCYFKAVADLPVSIAALLLYTYPPLVALLAWLTKGERVGWRQWTAIALAMLGVFLVKHGVGGGASTGRETEGAIAALIAATVYAGYLVISARLLKSVPALVAAAVVTSSAAAIFGIITLSTGAHVVPRESSGWLWLGLLVIVSTVIGIQAFFAGARRVAPSRASILGASEPVFAVALGAVFFAEQLNGIQILGGIVVLAASLLSRPKT